MSQITRLCTISSILLGIEYELDTSEVDRVRAHLGHKVNKVYSEKDVTLECIDCNETITIKGGLQNERS